MISIGVGFVYQAALLYGYGLIFSAALNRIGQFEQLKNSFYQTCYLGYFFLLILLYALHLFVPLETVVFAAVSLFGFAGYLILLKNNRFPGWDVFVTRRTLVHGVLLGILLYSILSTLAGQNQPNGDSRLYHLNWVKWANEFPAVPGLAGLHNRLGLNSGFLLYGAFIDNLWWNDSSSWLVNGFLLVLATSHWLSTILNPAATAATRVFCLVTLAYFLRLILTLEPGLQYDFSSNLFYLLALLEAIELLSRKQKTETSIDSTSWTRLVFFAFLSMVNKVSGVTVAAGFAVWATWNLRSRNLFRKTIGVFLFPALLTVLWAGRNLVTSGWILFPMPRFDFFNFDWETPRRLVEDKYVSIVGWARLPGPLYEKAARSELGYWFPDWLDSFSHHYSFYILAASIILILAAAGLHLLTRRRSGANFLLTLAAFNYANLAFWFFSAPAVRFAEHLIWSALAFSLLLISPYLTRLTPVMMRNMQPILYILVLAMGFLKGGYFKYSPEILAPLHTAPSAPVKTIHLSNVGNVLVPLEGDQCGNSPIPCTPYPDPTMKLRVAGQIGKGFKFSADTKTE